jgi:dimethylamine monooxygenase subunit A
MDFDINLISVPFRMRPGLVRLTPDAVHLTPLRAGSALHTEKSAIQRLGSSRRSAPGFDPSAALATIRTHALRAGVRPEDADTLPLELQVEEDLVVLDTHTARVPWMCVSVPSRWAPEEKLGRTLPEIHQPVADGAALAAALPAILRVLATGTHWERHVWTLTPSGRYDQHPGRQPPANWSQAATADELARQCHLRVERQTFIPILDSDGGPSGQAVFTIRVMLEPLELAIRSARDALRLHDALASMSDAVLAYKNLVPARDRLVDWLALRAAAGTNGSTPLVL